MTMNSDTIVHGLTEKLVVIKSLISVTRNLTEPKVYWLIDIFFLSWRPVLVEEEAGENHRPLASNC